jgi:hypothetical protein
MAILFATAFYRKGLEINLILFGRIRLLYIALFFLLVDLVSIERSNPGGHVAHIGGALMGIGFAQAALGGWDLTAGMQGAIDRLTGRSTSKRRRKARRQRVRPRPEGGDAEGRQKEEERVAIDGILDRMKRSGYNSLSDDEKKRLFDASR